MKTVSCEEVLELANNVVKDFGADYVYPGWETGCVYVRDNEPSCLVGHILHRLGVNIFDLATEELDACTGNAASIDVLWGIIAVQGVTFTTLARTFLSGVQGDQDSGVAWGKAVEYNVM